MSAPAPDHHSNRWLAVDLDGTLTPTDCLWECFARLITRDPLLVVRAVVSSGGKIAVGKAALARVVGRQIGETVPLRSEVVALIQDALQAGRPVVLATASDHRIAEAVVGRLPAGVKLLASDGVTNLKGRAKADALRSLCGPAGFEYAGDSMADIPVFAASTGALVVGGASSVLAAARNTGVPVRECAGNGGNRLRAWMKQLRVHQWTKNALVFAPVASAHLWSSRDAWRDCGIAFGAMCLVASAVYLFNDLRDLAEDRSHRTKCKRPLAAGIVPIRQALALIPVLVALSLSLAWANSPSVAAGVVIYGTLSLFYCIGLKRIFMADIVVLATLYVLRIVIGCLAIGVPMSPWLLGFAFFTFLGLAAGKRSTELLLLAERGGADVPGRGYRSGDFSLVQQAGVSSSMMTALLYILYVDSDWSRRTYERPELLWIGVPILVFWSLRFWGLVSRGECHDDPVVWALRDKTSWAVLLFMLLLMLAATG